MLIPLPSLPELAGALERGAPDAGPIRPLSVLGEGFTSLAVETAGGAVFRVPRIPQAAEGYALEARLLPRLSGRLPAAVPGPRWLLPPCDVLPFGAAGYPKLPGATLAPRLLAADGERRLAGEVGRFLAALHRVPVGEARALGVEQPALAEHLEEARDVVLPPLGDLLSADEYRTVAAWWDAFLPEVRAWRPEPVLVHGDTWYGNLLVDVGSGRLLGVLDWEDAGPGDPAVDLAAQLYLGEGFTRRVLDAYRAAGGAWEPGLPGRVARLWEVFEFGGVKHAARHGDAAEMEDSLRKLRAGPVLDPRARVTLG